jgi:hypothetical protein
VIFGRNVWPSEVAVVNEEDVTVLLPCKMYNLWFIFFFSFSGLSHRVWQLHAYKKTIVPIRGSSLSVSYSLGTHTVDDLNN